MGKGWKKSNWNRAAVCTFTGNSVESKKVLCVSLETSFDAIAVFDMGADTPGSLPNERVGNRPASPDSRPWDGSIMSGVPKKARTWGQATGILIDCLLGCGQDLSP